MDPLWTVAIVFLILYLLGLFALPAAGSLIHILLVVVIVLILIRLLR